MITIRFPNGQTLQYNTANYIKRNNEFTDLYTKKDGDFLVQVPNTCVIEYIFPCRVYNAMKETEITDIVKELKSIKRKLSAKSKR